MSEPIPTTTPRTDALEFALVPVVHVSHARTLERELTEQTQAARDATDFNSELLQECATERAAREQAEKQIAMDTECIERIRNVGETAEARLSEAMMLLTDLKPERCEFPIIGGDPGPCWKSKYDQSVWCDSCKRRSRIEQFLSSTTPIEKI